MRYMYVIMAFVGALLGLTKTANAQQTLVPPCTWSLNGGQKDFTTVKASDIVKVAVVTNAAGIPKTPAGWKDLGFTPGACVGYDQATCGVRTWETFFIIPTTARPEISMFSVENAGCTASTKTVAITVLAVTPAPEEGFWGKCIRGIVDMFVGVVLVPNNSFVTRPGRGFGASVGAKPVRTSSGLVGLKLESGFKWWRTAAPINPDLKPSTFEASSDIFAVNIVRPSLDISPTNWLQFDIGMGLGVLTQTWSQTIVRQDAGGVSVADSHMDTVATISPALAGTVVFGKYVGMRLEGALDVPLRARRYEVGSERKSAYVVPQVTGGLVVSF